MNDQEIAAANQIHGTSTAAGAALVGVPSARLISQVEESNNRLEIVSNRVVALLARLRGETPSNPVETTKDYYCFQNLVNHNATLSAEIDEMFNEIETLI